MKVQFRHVAAIYDILYRVRAADRAAPELNLLSHESKARTSAPRCGNGLAMSGFFSGERVARWARAISRGPRNPQRWRKLRCQRPGMQHSRSERICMARLQRMEKANRSRTCGVQRPARALLQHTAKHSCETRREGAVESEAVAAHSLQLTSTNPLALVGMARLWLHVR